MPRIAYNDWSPTKASKLALAHAVRALQDYAAEGYTVTLRQLYYRLVGRGQIENNLRSYKNLGNLMTKARMAGIVDWEAIEDRAREFHRPIIRESIPALLSILPDNILYDRWSRQDYYIEVWVEKEALGNVIEKACGPYFVPHMACKGYLSASEAWRGGERMRKRIEQGKCCVVIHLGDHDPSGIDMTRDNQQRLWTFARSMGVTVDRIALNMDQIEQYDPPPNPAKESDSRAVNYKSKYGNTSWELDALEPAVIERLITDKIKKYIDPVEWESVTEEEDHKKAILETLHQLWESDVEPMLEGYLNEQ